MRFARYPALAKRSSNGAASLVSMPASGEHHPAFEEYCECIFELDEDDVAVIQARIASRAGTSLVQAITAGTAPHGAIEQWLVQLWPSPTL